MKGAVILQDVLLNQTRKGRIPVKVKMVDGTEYQGLINGFDSFTIILDNSGKLTMLYKHAIASVDALKPISLNGFEPRKEII